MDATENVRREMVAEINNNPSPKQVLEEKHGKGNVWEGQDELREHFEVVGFMAPVCVVRRKSDGVKGSVFFQHNPRIYYGFQPE